MYTKDRRVRKTKEAIKRSLIKLVNETSFEGLTIGGLMADADLNRSTFYLHYSSLSEVLYAIEDEVIANLLEEVRGPHETIESLLLDVLSCAEANREALRCIFKASPTHFSRKVELIFTPVIYASPFTKRKNEDHGFTFVASFFIEGGIGVIFKWLENPMRVGKDELVASFLDYFVPKNQNSVKLRK